MRKIFHILKLIITLTIGSSCYNTYACDDSCDRRPEKRARLEGNEGYESGDEPGSVTATSPQRPAPINTSKGFTTARKLLDKQNAGSGSSSAAASVISAPGRPDSPAGVADLVVEKMKKPKQATITAFFKGKEEAPSAAAVSGSGAGSGSGSGSARSEPSRGTLATKEKSQSFLFGFGPGDDPQKSRRAQKQKLAPSAKEKSDLEVLMEPFGFTEKTSKGLKNASGVRCSKSEKGNYVFRSGDYLVTIYGGANDGFWKISKRNNLLGELDFDNTIRGFTESVTAALSVFKP
jgi:hypothetical protein